MLPASNAAEAYHFVCRHLRVSPRAQAAVGLTNFPNRPTNFVARAIESDAHAVALCAAFLVSHGVPWQHVLYFVSCYATSFPEELYSHETVTTNIVTLSTGCELTAISPTSYANTSDFVTGKFVGSSTDKTVITVDFSESPALSSLGAAAVIVACIVLPPPIRADVDLRYCSAVYELNLSPWLPLLNSFGVPPPAVTGLALDGCPLRHIPLQTLCHMPHLRWISLRGTRLRNFGRVADIVNGLPSLVAALFSGHPGRMNDLHRAQHIAHDEPGTVDTTFATASSNLSRAADFGELGQESASLGEWEIDGDDGEDVHKWPLHTSEFINDTPSENLLIHTPVSLRRNFRQFVLASRNLPLRFLDGAIVAPREQAAACTAVAARLETVQRRPRATQLLSLLRDRELGRGPRPVDLWRHTSSIRADRPRKRKRSILEHTSHVPNYRSQPPDHSSPASNFEAMMTAPVPPHAFNSVLSGSHQMAMVLAAAATYSRDTHLSQDSQTADSQHRFNIVPNTNPEFHGLFRSYSDRHRRRRAFQAPTPPYPFCEGLFEQCASSSLARRRGPPRLAFWKQGNDRPRQFEYNPAKDSEVVYATASGFLVVVNEASGIVEASCRAGGGPGIRRCGTSIARTNNLRDAIAGDTHEPAFASQRAPAVFGISWLNTACDVFISGKYGGDIHVYNVDWMRTGRQGGCMYACEAFDRLTSISVSADDTRFAVSGESCNVGIFDLLSGKRLETMHNCHTSVINVIKFAHHNPFVLLTSSFDGCVRKWDLRERRPNGSRRPVFTTHSRTDNMMACFSPDDQYLLVSAIDNDVRQYSACDGRLILDFDIAPTGNRYNYTRSYYMNNRDYIISGSCMESIVRVYNASSGALLTEVDVDDRHISSEHQLCVQSLRANPYRPFNFCALLVSKDNSVDEIIAQVDLRSR